jgi:hypothetical protein
MKHIACLFTFAALAAAQTHAPAIPRMPDGKPNLNGIWEHPYVPDVTKDGKDQKGAGPLPFTPEGADNFKNYDVSKFDYTGHCLPFGLMRSMNVGGYPIQIIQYDKYLALLFEQNTWFHVVALGREHPKNFDPTWFGDSIGKWDGDTLVIDTIGFNGKSWIDESGLPTTEKLHVIERIKRVDAGHLEIEHTVDDPGAYTAPWKFTTHPRLLKGELMEYICQENNRDLEHLVGPGK